MRDSTSMQTKILYLVVFLPLLGRSFFPMTRNTDSITFQSSFSDPQILGVYLLWGYCLWFLVRRPSNLRLAFAQPLWPLTLFVLVAASSVITVSRAPIYSLWRSMETCGVLLWGLLVLAEIRENRNPGRLFVSFYAMSSLMLLGVLIAVLIDPQHAWMREGTKVERLEVTSTVLMGANTIGVIAALLTLVMLSRFMVVLKFRYLIGSFIFLVLCYEARSRTGFIVFLLGALVLIGFLLRMPSRRLITGVGGILLSILAVGLLLVSPEFTDAVTSTFTRGHSEENIKSLDGRMTIWTSALEGFQQSPFLGSGYATYPMQIKGGGHFHNMFVELAVTTGLLGLIPILILFSLLAARLLKLFLLRLNGEIFSCLESLDALLLGTVIIVSEMTTAGAAYYSWQMIGVVALTVGLHSMLDNFKTNGKADCCLEVFGPMHTLEHAQGGIFTPELCKGQSFTDR